MSAQNEDFLFAQEAQDKGYGQNSLAIAVSRYGGTAVMQIPLHKIDKVEVRSPADR